MRPKLGLATLGLCVALLTVPALGQSGNKAETYRLLNLFGDVFERVRAEYVEEAGDKELIESAINGMLTALDPHSSYLNAESFKEMQVQTRGEFGGLGIEVTMENGFVKVVSPIDDTPAARAGVEPGDLITHLNGEPVLGMSLSEAVKMMRGPVNTDLKITVRRARQEPFELAITRDVIRIKSVRSRLEGPIGYIRITSFNEQTDVSLRNAVRTLEEESETPLIGFVLDLRNNPGGLLDQAVAVSDAFLEQGEVVSTRSRRPEEGQRFNARAGDVIDGRPLVVLINGGSASASEIVAGALQDHRRALVLGTKSFGKGSVQTIIPLHSYGAMRLTTARYYTPSGRSIQAVGIEPDIQVEQARIESLATGPRRREADLRGALGNDSDPASADGRTQADEPAPLSETDYQLSRALDLLKGLALYGENAGRAG
jgi:carboxyl-terminal processing protease